MGIDWLAVVWTVTEVQAEAARTIVEKLVAGSAVQPAAIEMNH